MEQGTRAQADEKRSSIDTFHLFDADEFLPGHQLLVNVSTSIVSLLTKAKEPEQEQEIRVIAQRILTHTQMRVFLPLLIFPSCCPQEVLLVSYHCAYEILLRYVLCPDANTIVQWNALVQHYRNLLNEAHQRGTHRVEMRGVYNALFGFRPKLEELGLTIHTRRGGYSLSRFKK